MNVDSFVLAAATADLADEPRAREHADALEFRMDLADEPLAALERYDGELPILATNRASWEGGNAPDAGRLEALAEATAHDGVEAIDVELASILEGDASALLEVARSRDVRVVASSHDFEETPPQESMRETLVAACECDGVDVGKLAVVAETHGDTLDVLAVTHELTRAGHAVATMAMGTVGSHTRAVAPVYGSRIGYAPVDPAEATAPGQFDLETLSELVARLSTAEKREN